MFHDSARHSGTFVISVLFLAAAALSPADVSAQTCSSPGVSGTFACSSGPGGSSGGSGSGRSRPAGPSAAELAERRRRAQANAINAAGLEAFNKGDFQTAEQQFRQYLRMYPDDQVVANNLAVAINGLGTVESSAGKYEAALIYFQTAADLQKHLKHPAFSDTVLKNLRETQQTVQTQRDKAAASGKIQRLLDASQVVAPAPAASKLTFDDVGTAHGAPAPGTKDAQLDFGSFTPAASGVSGTKTQGGLFNTKDAKPDIAAAPSSKVGGDVKAGDQLRGAANAVKGEDTAGDLTKSFDAGGAHKDGSLSVVLPHSVDLSGFSPAARNHPDIIAIVKRLDALQATRGQLEKERDDLTKQRDATKDPDAFKALDVKVTQKTAEYQINLTSIAQQTQALETRHRDIDVTVAAPK